MASYMLFEKLVKFGEKELDHTEKVWLIDTINNKLNLDGKEKLYSLLVVYNYRQTTIYDPKEPFYEIEKIPPKLQRIWYEFTKMHLKYQKSIKKV